MSGGLQPAFVLHARRYRESSLIVELITRDHGRQAVMAKGAMSGKRPLAAMLQPFVPLLVDWRGRGELPTLSAVEQAEAMPQAQGRSAFCGLYVNELLLKLTQRADPHSELFPLYAACIGELLESPSDNASLEPLLRRFELQLLDELGLGLQLREDHQGRAVEAGRRYVYDIESGPVESAQARSGFDGASLLALDRGMFETDQQRREARSLMRLVLDSHLHGQPLKSRELFR